MITKYQVNDRVVYQGDTATVMDAGLKEAFNTDENGLVTVTKQVPVYLIQVDYVEGETPPDGISVVGDEQLTSATA